jgi:hypothetical protein
MSMFIAAIKEASQINFFPAYRYKYTDAVRWQGHIGAGGVLFRWRNPHQTRHISLFRDLKIRMSILFLDFGSRKINWGATVK